MLSQKDDKGEDSVDRVMARRLKKDVHLLSRVDRPVSGLLMLSTLPAFTKHYLKQQESEAIEKEYIAIVQGAWKEKDSEVVLYHKHDTKNRKARISADPHSGGTQVKMQLEQLRVLDNYSILKVTLITGRFHQIRACLSHLEHPIKGDVKYGARRKNPDRSIHLHSYKIRFVDRHGDKKEFDAPFPEGSLWDLANRSLK